MHSKSLRQVFTAVIFLLVEGDQNLDTDHTLPLLNQILNSIYIATIQFTGGTLNPEKRLLVFLTRAPPLDGLPCDPFKRFHSLPLEDRSRCMVLGRLYCWGIFSLLDAWDDCCCSGNENCSVLNYQLLRTDYASVFMLLLLFTGGGFCPATARGKVHQPTVWFCAHCHFFAGRCCSSRTHSLSCSC